MSAPEEAPTYLLVAYLPTLLMPTSSAPTISPSLSRSSSSVRRIRCKAPLTD